MLRTVALLAVSLSACVSTPNDATLSLGMDNQTGNVEVQYNRTDPNYQLGTLTASINGIDLGTPIVNQGGCDTNKNDILGGGCEGSYATFEISPTTFASAAGADVTVTEDAEVFHFGAPTFFAARAVAVQTGLEQPISAHGAIVAADTTADDQVIGSMTVTTTTECGIVYATGAGPLDFQLDPSQFDPSCVKAAGTTVPATFVFELRAQPTQTCTGPENLTCQQDAPTVRSTVTGQIQF